MGLLEVVDELFVFVSIVDREFEFSFFGPEDDRLTFHAADHVEGGFGLTAQGHLQQVFFDAGFDGLAQLRSNFEEAVRGTKAFNALMRSLVVVIFDPETDTFPSGVEAFKLGAGEELLPDGFPKALDLAQGHRVMRPGLEMVRAVLFHLGLKASDAAPVDVLAAIVGEHLFGRLELAGRDPKYFQHVLSRVAAEQIGADHEP